MLGRRAVGFVRGLAAARRARRCRLGARTRPAAPALHQLSNRRKLGLRLAAACCSKRDPTRRDGLSVGASAQMAERSEAKTGRGFGAAVAAAVAAVCISCPVIMPCTHHLCVGLQRSRPLCAVWQQQRAGNIGQPLRRSGFNMLNGTGIYGKIAHIGFSRGALGGYYDTPPGVTCDV